MGDTPSGVVARRMWPSSVASLGRVTHAPADSTLYRAMMRGQLLHPSGAAPGFDGAGSIRHRSQNFLRRWGLGAELFKWGWGGGFGCSDKFLQSMSYVGLAVPQFQFINRVVDSYVVLQRRFPTVQTVQKTGVILQVQFLDKVDDARCCTTTGAWVTTV